MSRQFAKMPLDVLARRDLRPASKLVYAAILDRIGDRGSAWPGYRRIASDTGLNNDVVQRAVEQLVERGLVVRTEGRRRGFTYTVQDTNERPENPDNGSAREIRAQAPGKPGQKRPDNRDKTRTNNQNQEPTTARPSSDVPEDYLRMVEANIAARASAGDPYQNPDGYRASAIAAYRAGNPYQPLAAVQAADAEQARQARAAELREQERRERLVDALQTWRERQPAWVAEFEQAGLEPWQISERCKLRARHRQEQEQAAERERRKQEQREPVTGVAPVDPDLQARFENAKRKRGTNGTLPAHTAA